MSVFVKICGISDIVTAEACVDAGADAIGFVFAASPRRVTVAQANAIARSLPEGIKKVAVFRLPATAELDRVLDGFEADAVQADHVSVRGLEGVETLPVYRQGVDDDPPNGRRFLYEGPVSGVGKAVGHHDAAKLARRGEMILAGGLRPGNVGEAIDRVRPFGVDVSSGVESELGRKDPAAIHAFVARARAAQDRLVST